MTRRGSSRRAGLWEGRGLHRGTGVEGEQSLEEGALGMSPPLSLKKSQWLFSNCIRDTRHLRKIWKIKESNTNKEESSRLFR